MPDAIATSSPPSPEAGRFPRIAIFAIYFGPLPGYFSLWLESCARNPDFDWFVLTDADLSAFAPPPNVRARPMTLAQFGETMSRALELELALEFPYKVCDFRPAYWILLKDESENYEFWGHCDLDLIFGDLRSFITKERLEQADKIFTLGHLTLYRNVPFCNEMFRQPHPELDWRAILSDPRPRGFDEHIGVGRLWRRHRSRILKDEAIVADIDPAVARFERAAPYRNDRDQLFFYDRGRVFRVYWRWGRKRREEFLYIHFQKRRTMTALPGDAESYVVAPGGFFACSFEALTRELARRLNPTRLSMGESLHRWRAAFRHFRRKRGWVRDLRGAYR